MTPAFVQTIREEIYYEYVKLISRSAYHLLQRAFITDRFKKLRNGEITISGTMREWEREQELPKICIYCGTCLQRTLFIEAGVGRIHLTMLSWPARRVIAKRT